MMLWVCLVLSLPPGPGSWGPTLDSQLILRVEVGSGWLHWDAARSPRASGALPLLPLNY